MLKFYKKLRALFLDLLFPLECFNCGLEGDYLCANCFEKLKINDEKYLALTVTNLKIETIKKIYIAGSYEDPLLSNLIKKYKYNFLSALAEILARFLIIFWTQNKPAELNKNNFLIIPIPLSAQRFRWRGFNQAELIARKFSAHFNYELNLDLKRVKHRAPQANLNEAERLKNITSAFIWTGKNLNNYSIILIDDVVTTGATLNEAAQTLKSAGASEIFALVLAKG